MIINVKSNCEDGVERMEILSFMISKKISLEVTVILGQLSWATQLSRATLLSRATCQLNRATTIFFELGYHLSRAII